ncbi:uncharacterized protein LOC136071238 [Quercus suber]|uniref:uncharacterized protein LOC136071238 n=1 Tax=Quercus suber TaxID=58331 RepID=UPI0032DF5A46
MSKALDQLSKSPFMRHIGEATLPRWFQELTFSVYNGKTELVEHVSQFNQRMAVHPKNEVLMCKIASPGFWLSLRYKQHNPTALERATVSSMHDGETLKAYSGRYWEVYNEVEGNFDDVAINTFKNGLLTGHGLRKSLTGKPATNMRQLMDWIEKYKRVEEDQLQGRGKEKTIP